MFQSLLPIAKIFHICLLFTHLQDLKVTDVEQHAILFAPPQQKGN